MSAIKGWGAESFYARFTQRLTSALSAPTGEGTLYEVDLKLRPSGTKGPVAVSFAAFEDYYEREAETWELQALTRARVIWAVVAGLPGPGRGRRSPRPCAGRATRRRPPSTCWRCAS
jgi:glutamine synthetase adenylyltransferase